MKVKKLVLLLVSIVIFNFFLNPHEESILATESQDIRQINQKYYPETDARILQFEVEEAIRNNSYSYYSIALQEQLADQVNQLKESDDFTIDNPLFILNPFGTLTNSLFVSFDEAAESNVYYQIKSQLNGQEQIFNQQAYLEEGQTDFLIMGLIPGTLNQVTIELRDNSDQVQSSYQFEIKMPRNKSFYPNQIHKVDGNSLEELSDGLFYTLGSSGYSGYSFFFDNEGYVRAELKLNSYRMDNLILYKDHLYFATHSSTLAKMNRLGQIVRLYSMSGYNMHHDFMIGREDEMLVLASINDVAIPRREDLILSIDLESGQVQELVDLKFLLSDYYLRATPHLTSSGNPDLDWIHINSLDKVAEDELILSSRETSTIIKISDIYDQIQLDYLIGPDDLWFDTIYADKLLDPVNSFTLHAGQHSLNYSRDESLAEDQYYIEFYNNNYWWILTRPEYEEGFDPDQSKALDSNPYDKSYYYKYLVDEAAGSYELVDSIPVPYSSIVSNVQIMDNDNILINSGKANVVGEYDSQANLIANYEYPSSHNGFTYRVFKNDFQGFWFE